MTASLSGHVKPLGFGPTAFVIALIYVAFGVPQVVNVRPRHFQPFTKLQKTLPESMRIQQCAGNTDSLRLLQTKQCKTMRN